MEMEPGKLFIGGISWDTSEERLREYFETYGEVIETVIMKDRATGRARGFGFVVFANASVAEKVVKERHIIDGRTVSNAALIAFNVFPYVCVMLLIYMRFHEAFLRMYVYCGILIALCTLICHDEADSYIGTSVADDL